NVQKKLLVAPSTSTFRNGRSKITIATTGGFVLRGISGTPSLMDWIGGTGTTYYTFVDSGALTVVYSTITNADEGGLRLTGSAGVSLASSTFDLAGEGLSSTNTYITANSLTSNATFYGMTFNNSRSSGTVRYNVWASSEVPALGNLSWFFTGWSGARGGESFDKEDPNTDKVTWGPQAGAI